MTMTRHKVWMGIAAIALPAAAATAQVDQRVVQQIIDEGKNHSQVWDHLMYLSDEIGTRLTGSTGLMEANAWTRDMFKAFGCDTAYLHKWGEIPVRFDRGPSTGKMLSPVEREFEFTTRAWSAGTDGPVKGPVFKAPKDDAAFEAIKDDLAGAWILSPGRSRGGRRGVLPPGTVPPLTEEMSAKLFEAGIAGVITAARGELVVTGGSWRNMSFDNLPTEVTVTVRRSDYDAINSRLADGESVEVEFNLEHHFTEGPIPLYNTVAEITGTEFPEQVVILSGHLDTWDGPGSKGTQDNGTGSSVMLEAARILNKIGVKPRRTIRFILWTGEEQGLLGSRAYCDSLSPEEMANISAAFVDDGGTNYQGGVTSTPEMAPIFEAAFAPVRKAFPDMPIDVDVRERLARGGGSDHASFVQRGVPGFFFMESGSGGREGKNYRYIHHTQHDTPRYAVPEYLVQSATNSAVLAYHMAMIDDLLPREKPVEPDASESDSSWRTMRRGPLAGVWKNEMSFGETTMSFTIEFQRNSEREMGGIVKSQRGDNRFTGPTFDQGTGAFSFTVNSEMGELTYSGTIKGDEMTGTLSAGDRFSVDFKGKRESTGGGN